MAGQVKLAINWAAACGGCDVALLDLEQQVLQLAERADFVFWPVAMDFKREQLEALPAGSVDVGIFNGAVRTEEQARDARVLREKSKLLVAFGACACFGGIPGLGNVADRDDLLQTVYRDAPGVDNPDGVVPAARTLVNGVELTLPELEPAVRALHQVVDVDLYAPGCPPVPERLQELVQLLLGLADGQDPPPRGSFLASDRGLCHECPRGATRGQHAPATFVRAHQVLPDPEQCLLDQGLVCMGIATRGGCGARCVQVNMACRGCYGPLPRMLDPAAELVSALAALPGPRGEWEMPLHQVVGPARKVKDPLGTFYRFTYPVSLGRRTITDKAKD